MPLAQQLGRYQLLDRIAFGGMAEIFRAKTWDADGRAQMVAVKKVLKHLTTDEYFIAMEHVDGKDVRSLLERHRAAKRPIPAEHVAWIALHVAEGLNAA